MHSASSVWSFALVVGWLALAIGASILYRRSQDLPLFPRVPASAQFVEWFASGWSLRNLWTRMGSASNCLLVTVTADKLIVRPWFPFNMMFLPELFDLEHMIPRNKIISVEPAIYFLAKIVKVTFINKHDKQQTIALYVRKRDAFIHALMN
jgi:hypothetical protein